MSTSLLEVKEICKSYPGVQALDRVSLKIKQGEIHALVGENGAGKSTLIKIIAGAELADSGELEMLGSKILVKNSRASSNYGISVLYQDLQLIPTLTVAENLMIGQPTPLKMKTFVDWRSVKKTAQLAIDRVGETFSVDTLVRDLTQSQRVMTAIAKALNSNSKLIIMDEPTAALSSVEADKLHSLIQELSDANVAILYVSHRLDEILKLASQITVLKNGSLVGSYPREEIQDKDNLTRLIVGREFDRGKRTNTFTEDNKVLVEVRDVFWKQNLKGVSLDLKKGEVVGLAGLVGTGRSELARLIFGVERANSGIIKIKGKILSGGSPRIAISNGIAMLPEDRLQQAVFSALSVRTNVTITSIEKYTKFFFIARKREGSSVGDLVEKLKIKVADINKPIRNLSGGNQQKVVVSRWLDCAPEVLIFDEPTQGVDVGAKGEILGIVRDSANQGCAVLFISSEFDEIVEVSDRVLVLSGGKIVSELIGSDINREEILKNCYLSDQVG